MVADKLNISDRLAFNLAIRGSTYMMMGDNDQAIENFERSLTLSKTIGYSANLPFSQFYLVLIHLDKNSHDQAHQYLTRLKEFSEKFNSEINNQLYMIAKALMLKSSNRIHDHAEAEHLLKQIIESDIIVDIILHIKSIISLCDLLLEELSIYNNSEVLDEINILIKQLLKIGESQRSSSWLAEAKLLQAKLALIEMNIEEAKLLLTEAQNIAESQDLNRLSIKISSEHDKLLEQMTEWNNLKNAGAPMAERIKLASLDGVIDRLQGKRAVEPPELIDERPTLLLIIAEGGVLIFSYPFTDEWKRNDELFSSFLSAFISFSNEFFTKGLDRAKFGDDLILMQSVGPFSICYLFKGQTYPATQRLKQFIEKIQNTTSIWQSLERFYETSQVLELEDSPSLESLITEIFMSKNPILENIK